MRGAPRSPPHFLIPSYAPQDFWPLPVSFDIIFKTLLCLLSAGESLQKEAAAKPEPRFPGDTLPTALSA